MHVLIHARVLFSFLIPRSRRAVYKPQAQMNDSIPNPGRLLIRQWTPSAREAREEGCTAIINTINDTMYQIDITAARFNLCTARCGMEQEFMLISIPNTSYAEVCSMVHSDRGSESCMAHRDRSISLDVLHIWLVVLQT